jgi:hypothetical protein
LETRRAGDGRGDGHGESKDARGSDCVFWLPLEHKNRSCKWILDLR